MYVWVTERCNMTCDHCCNNATAKGKHMSIKTFRNFVKHFGDDEHVSLGGGEPTLHPHFWEIIGLSLGHFEYTWLATNGSKTDIALALARMAQKGVLGCALSQDQEHDQDLVDSRVVHAFTRDHRRSSSVYDTTSSNDGREVRNVFENDREQPLVAAGRAIDNFDESFLRKECPCEELQLMINGDVHWCGCPDAPVIGNVNEGSELHEVWRNSDCYECWKSADEETKGQIYERFGIKEGAGIGHPVP